MKHKHNGTNPFKNENLDENQNLENDTEDKREENIEKKETTDSTCTENEFEKLKTDYDTLNSQYMRLAADFENFRKRQEGERENLLRFGLENALTKLIEVLDNFERAQKAMTNVEDISKYKESFDLIYKQVKETLSKLGLEEIEAQGKEFDPNFHDAVMQTPTSEQPENTIIAELQKGYKLGEKVLRPSLVNVAAAE